MEVSVEYVIQRLSDVVEAIDNEEFVVELREVCLVSEVCQEVIQDVQELHAMNFARNKIMEVSELLAMIADSLNLIIHRTPETNSQEEGQEE